MTQEKLTDTILLEKFQDHLKVRDKSNIYVSPISIYLVFCTKNSYEVSNIRFDQLNKFLLYLKEKKNKSGYINNFIKALKFFYINFLDEYELCTLEAVAAVKKLQQLKRYKVIREYLKEDELNDIVRDSQTYITVFPYYKSKALLEFMFYTGLRKQEIINLKRKDINLETKTLIVRIPTKNREEGIAYFPERVKKSLEEYFLNEAEEENAFNLTNKKIRTFIEQLNQFAPSGKRITPHTFRHSFGRMLARKKFRLLEAQKLLRHKVLEDTLIYYQIENPEIEESYREKIG